MTESTSKTKDEFIAGEIIPLLIEMELLFSRDIKKRAGINITEKRMNMYFDLSFFIALSSIIRGIIVSPTPFVLFFNVCGIFGMRMSHYRRMELENPLPTCFVKYTRRVEEFLAEIIRQPFEIANDSHYERLESLTQEMYEHGIPYSIDTDYMPDSLICEDRLYASYLRTVLNGYPISLEVVQRFLDSPQT